MPSDSVVVERLRKLVERAEFAVKARKQGVESTQYGLDHPDEWKAAAKFAGVKCEPPRPDIERRILRKEEDDLQALRLAAAAVEAGLAWRAADLACAEDAQAMSKGVVLARMYDAIKAIDAIAALDAGRKAE